MSNPLNEIDFIRFKKLAAEMMRSGCGEVSIYAVKSSERPGKAYINIEMKSHEVNWQECESAFSIPIQEIAALREKYNVSK